MARIPLFGIGQASKSPFVTAKGLQNLYAEARPQGEKSSLVCYFTPGLSAAFVDFGATPCRGGLEFDVLSVAFVVHRGVLWEVNNAGVKTNRGALLTTSGRVSMSDNGVQVMIVDGTYGYIYNTQTNVFAQITDVDFPANPLTVTFLAGRFIINLQNSGRFYCSDLYDGLSWDALNFANAESSPDPIVAVWTNNGQLALFGTHTTEYWGSSGALDFPFSMIAGTSQEWGLSATWSLAIFDNTCAGLFKNRMGQVLICRIQGYEVSPISTVDMDAIVNDYANTADATAYSYLLGGHPMYVISFPSAGYSWMFDGTTGFWSKLKSYGASRYRGEFGFAFLDSVVVADYNDGKMYRIDPNALTDNGDTIEREIIGETIRSENGEFIDVSCLRLDLEVGVGLTSGQGVNPQIALSISRDNGKTWGPDMWKPMGAIGEYATRVEWRRLGSPRVFTPKIRVTDPVRVCIVSASLNPDN